MFFYIFSTLFIVIFGLFGGYSKNKEFAAFSRFFVFVWLFFFSAARYGIGTDYPHYEFYYDAIGNGNKIYKFSSPLYYCLNLICNFMQLDFKSFIVICSFLTCFFFFYSDLLPHGFCGFIFFSVSTLYSLKV